MPLLSQDYVIRYKLPPEKTQAELRDTKLTGFWMRVRRRSDGTLIKAFMIDHLVALSDGRKVRRKVSIGDAALFHADKARIEAQRLLQAVKRGDDPRGEKAARKSRMTFDMLVEQYREKRLARRKPATRKDYEGRIRRVLLPYFKGRFADDVTTAMVIDCHHKHRRTPTEANRALAVLSAMMQFAISQGVRRDNPCLGVERYSETAKDTWLNEQELPMFIAALGEVETPVGELLRFLAVTGWRVSEARLLDWADVDLPRMLVRLPDSKIGAIDRPLSADAAMIVDQQPHRSGFVFSTTNGRRPVGYKQTRDTLAAVCKKAEVATLTPHGLRHTFATWAALAGASAHELRDAGGWRTLAMTNRYVSRAETLGRAGAEKAARAINIFAKPTADVLKLKT
ncbi:tyrosine-type recombinase/integrase [Rhizobium mayense]|uniref:Site-specific integrase n=1 Tax=Rhizobium mayense TaxID=1312184 RepID=A0ABT7JPZ8_9HYPH|nr:site-specific integrase [Rhizobium mayense]MDL2398421.1 site-specific integrase [Rhizobium mayense]